MTIPTVSSAWIKGIIRLFESVGLDIPELFEDAGIDLKAVEDHDARFPTERISHLWELAVARSGNPALGLAMPDTAHPGSFDLIVHVMMACPNLLAAIERLLRYLRIVSDAVESSLLPEEGGYGLSMNLSGGRRPVPRARIEFSVLITLNMLRWLTGLRLRPVAVDFSFPEPGDLRPYQLAFRCPLRFNAPIHQIHLSHADLIAPLSTANPVLVALNDRMADEHLVRLTGARIALRAKELIARSLPDGDPLRAEVAREMCLSERTLHRRLREEGTSFNQLVDVTRKELADQYLRTSHIALAQVAYLLGFADQSTFFRSCRRWFGISPGEYRNRIRQG